MENERTAELLAQLANGVLELRTTDGWGRWLETQAKFHQYSFGNVVLIMAQRPDASHVAGFHKWLELGRAVRKGEHGIRILAPCVVKREDEETGETVRRVVGFRSAVVFDIAQTDGQELAGMPCHPLRGEAPSEQRAALEAFAEGLGFQVEYSELPGTRNGDTSHAIKRIRVSHDLSPAMTIKTLSHEIAHAVLHGQDFKGERAQAELEAESTAYLICAELGLDSSEYSFGYVAAWSASGDVVKGLQESGQRIVKAAQRITEGLQVRQAVAA